MFTAPKIINSSASEVCATLNDSVKIYCTFNASTIHRATIVVWLKDHTVISGYDNETNPVGGKDNVLSSVLYMKRFTHEDQGEYSCYCYYNQSIVTSTKPVTSDHATVNIHTDCSATGKSEKSKDKLLSQMYVCMVHLTLTENRIPWTWVIIISTVIIALCVICTVAAVIYMGRRCKKHGTCL